MNKKVWASGAAGLFAGVMLIIAFLSYGRSEQSFKDALFSSKPTSSPEPVNAQTVDEAGVIEQKMQEIGAWKMAGASFSTDTDEPLILLQNDKQIVYIQHNQVRYEWIGGNPYSNIPLSFPTARSGYIWRSGATAYIGITPQSGSLSARGDWYAINFNQLPGSNPLRRLGDIQLSPDHVRRVTFSNKPEGALFLEWKDGKHQEYWMSAQGKDQLYVNDYSARSQPLPPSITEQSVQKLQFDQVHELESGNSFALEDELGVIVYQGGDAGPRIYRMSGYDFQQMVKVATDPMLRMKPPYVGKDAQMFYLTSRSDRSSKAFILPTARPHLFTPAPALMEPNWTLIEGLSFVKKEEDRISVLSYPLQQGDQDEAPARAASISTAGMTDINRQYKTITGLKDAKERYASLDDLMNVRQPDETGGSLWMKALPEGRKLEGRKPGPPQPKKMLSLPKLESSSKESSEEQVSVPEELRNALQARDREAGGADKKTARTVRRIGEQWYVFTGDSVESWSASAGFRLSGRLPAEAGCLAAADPAKGCDAMDAVQAGDAYYVTNPARSLLLKLDQSWTLVSKAQVPEPSKLRVTKDGHIEVQSLKGLQTFDTRLTAMTSKPAVVRETNETPLEEVSVDPQAYYEDANRLRWIAAAGRLYVHDPNKHQVVVHELVTQARSYDSAAKLIPYRNQVLLLLGDRIHMFDSKGNWQSEILLNAAGGEESGEAGLVATGNSSYVLDQERGVLYIAQGFKVLGVDLQRGSVRTLFCQLRADLGKLLMYKDKLYATLQSASPGEEAATGSRELLMLDVRSGDVTRYLLPGKYLAESVSDQHELELLPQADSGRSDPPSEGLALKLSEQGGIE